ncbi:hypothetical protein [Microcella sp.]|uniref:hypothetical protein n=1 Tax=Microcella sp. TaxID=1913979 RepID=UPI00391B6486
MGMPVITRVARFALAVALAVAGVAMVSHHVGSDVHVVAVHEHPSAELAAGDGAHEHAAAHGNDHDHGTSHDHDHGLLMMGCAALVVALLASLRYAPPALGIAATPERRALSTVTPHSSAEPAPPPLDQLCVLRR